MSDAWNRAQQLADKHAANGGIYLRFQNDGDKALVVFCGPPHAREVYWDGQTYTEVKPEGTTAKASLRIALNAFVPGEGMKVIEGGGAWFKDLITVRDKYGLDKWLFEVKRHGKPKDPKTKYTILPERPMDDALRAQIAKAPLHDLARTSGDDGDSAEVSKNIDLDTAKAIADRLRALPRVDADTFLPEFKLTRIRDLLSSELPAALRFIEGLEAKHHVDVDPFAV